MHGINALITYDQQDILNPYAKDLNDILKIRTVVEI